MSVVYTDEADASKFVTGDEHQARRYLWYFRGYSLSSLRYDAHFPVFLFVACFNLDLYPSPPLNVFLGPLLSILPHSTANSEPRLDQGSERRQVRVARRRGVLKRPRLAGPVLLLAEQTQRHTYTPE